MLLRNFSEVRCTFNSLLLEGEVAILGKVRWRLLKWLPASILIYKLLSSFAAIVDMVGFLIGHIDVIVYKFIVKNAKLTPVFPECRHSSKTQAFDSHEILNV